MTCLSVAIIARDEERYIGACLQSLAGLADEVVVLLDDRTTDNTAAICRAAGAQVHLVPWPGFPAQRMRALALCRGTWVLFVDADERVPPPLAHEIRLAIAHAPAWAGFWIPRYNLFFGQRLQGGGWYPDYQLRLVRRTAASYNPAHLVHEVATLQGEATHLHEHLIHDNIASVAELWHKQRSYAFAEARTLYLQGQRARRRNFVARPLRELWRRFVQLEGWRDGLLGLMLGATMGWFELVKFLHLKGLEQALVVVYQPGIALPVSAAVAATPVDVAVIIVSWNVRDVLRACIASLHESLAQGHYSSRIIVVDNASHDGSLAMLRHEFPEVELIDAGSNLGFSAGNNLAIRYVGNTARYLLLLNPDTVVVGDAIPRLVAYLDTHPDTDVVGPQLRYPDGTLQSSRRRFPTAATFFWESTPLDHCWPTNPWARRYRYEDRPADGVQVVDWLVGAALLVRRRAVERAGVFDERFFMYSEELEWQWRIQNGATEQEGRIVYLPAAQILHYEGRSSEQVSLQRHLVFQRSKIRFARMRHGALFAFVLRLFLLLCYALQLAVEAAKWGVGHRRALRRQRIALYSRILRTGLC